MLTANIKEMSLLLCHLQTGLAFLCFQFQCASPVHWPGQVKFEQNNLPIATDWMNLSASPSSGQCFEPWPGLQLSISGFSTVQWDYLLQSSNQSDQLTDGCQHEDLVLLAPSTADFEVSCLVLPTHRQNTVSSEIPAFQQRQPRLQASLKTKSLAKPLQW